MIKHTYDIQIPHTRNQYRSKYSLNYGIHYAPIVTMASTHAVYKTFASYHLPVPEIER